MDTHPLNRTTRADSRHELEWDTHWTPAPLLLGIAAIALFLICEVLFELQLDSHATSSLPLEWDLLLLLGFLLIQFGGSVSLLMASLATLIIALTDGKRLTWLTIPALIVVGLAAWAAYAAVDAAYLNPVPG